MKTDMKINLKEMREEMTASMEARIDANNEKSEVPRSILISQMDIHKAKTESVQKKNKRQDRCPSGKDGSHYECLRK
jgi:hypothetical protein